MTTPGKANARLPPGVRFFRHAHSAPPIVALASRNLSSSDRRTLHRPEVGLYTLILPEEANRSSVRVTTRRY